MAGRGTPHSGVYIDVSHLGVAFVSRISQAWLSAVAMWDLTWLASRWKYHPAHYLMGGVRIDTACRSNIEGLFVAGEDASGVHGANRLGGNGVGCSTVFGGIAGDSLAAYTAGQELPQIVKAEIQAHLRGCCRPSNAPG